ncbi:GntR family transcriptional regulator [Amycolatopsis vastitatis]|uniref:GntR family transcriptional regulator n=1 Tax=Amycolatopsis vastitatis TaxID=1905142 RepID=A0A229TBV8_9PSEU|nr:GntR family transcriptional regulator [Amycolatopsis vastitatis]OXM68404.1 GntR family transcriptional regulator [Amycolatopsis vastitatis]
MLISLDLSGDVPIYQQLRDRIVEGIAAGTLTGGESLPSTRQLAADFGINFHTVNKAYDLLRQQGFVRLNRKSGAVVDPAAADDAFAAGWSVRARTLLAEAVAKGLPADEVLATCRALLADFGEQDERQGDEAS